jgi:DNA-binding beta-propeller fold protein YncE
MHVVDPESRKVIGTIAPTPGVHGAAFAPELKRAFLTCGGDATIQVVDTTTFKVVGSVNSTGKKPDAILYDPATRSVFVMNNGSDSITVFEAESLKLRGTLALSGAPEFPQTDGKGTLFVNLEDRNAIAVIDMKALKVVKEWSLAPAATPTGLAIDVEHRRLFSGCRSKHLVVADMDFGKTVATLPIGEGVDACAYDPATHRIYASCKDGTVSVIEAKGADEYRLVGSFRTERGSKTLALDPSSHRLYVPAAGNEGTPGDPKAGFQVLEFQP